MKLYLRNDGGVAMKFVGIRRVENAGQILKWKYIKSKLELNKIAARWPAKAVAQFFLTFIKKQ